MQITLLEVLHKCLITIQYVFVCIGGDLVLSLGVKKLLDFWGMDRKNVSKPIYLTIVLIVFSVSERIATKQQATSNLIL